MEERKPKVGIISISQKLLDTVENGKKIPAQAIDQEAEKLTYQQKLQSPKWQRVRLKVFERDNFTCQLCADEETQLQCHHLSYCKGEPWEIDLSQLITLCKDCHHSIECAKKEGFINYINEGLFVKSKNSSGERFSFFITDDRVAINVWSINNDVIAGTTLTGECLERLKKLISKG